MREYEWVREREREREWDREGEERWFKMESKSFQVIIEKLKSTF